MRLRTIGLHIVLLSVIFFSVKLANAQEASTSLNIILADVLSIDPGSAANGGSVGFNYQTVEDYNSEQTATVKKSLIITFTKDFNVRVKASGEYFESGDNKIPISVITIRRNGSSTVTGTSTPVVLSTSDQILVAGASYGSQLELDLDYIIPQSASSSEDILGKPAGNYSQTVIYTATAL